MRGFIFLPETSVFGRGLQLPKWETSEKKRCTSYRSTRRLVEISHQVQHSLIWSIRGKAGHNKDRPIFFYSTSGRRVSPDGPPRTAVQGNNVTRTN